MNPSHPRHQEYALEIFSDSACVKDITKAILHTIFFHRFFTPITPLTRDLLDSTLPAIDDANLETLIDQRATSLVRVLDQNDMAQGKKGGGRAQIAVQFAEKKRRKSGYAFWGSKGEEEVVWEVWVLDIAVATPRTDAGTNPPDQVFAELNADKQQIEVAKVRRAMEQSLRKTAMKIVTIVNRDKDHIPPITTTDANPFPYQIVVNTKNEGWGQRLSVFQR